MRVQWLTEQNDIFEGRIRSNHAIALLFMMILSSQAKIKLNVLARKRVSIKIVKEDQILYKIRIMVQTQTRSLAYKYMLT